MTSPQDPAFLTDRLVVQGYVASGIECTGIAGAKIELWSVRSINQSKISQSINQSIVRA